MRGADGGRPTRHLSLGRHPAEWEAAGRFVILEMRLERNAVVSGDFNITPLPAISQGRTRKVTAGQTVTIDHGIHTRAMPSETSRGMTRSNRRLRYGTVGATDMME
jgi:hypothetical protein